MANSQLHINTKILASRLARLLDTTETGRTIREFANTAGSRCGMLVVFGGVLRDLMTDGDACKPRDVDLVVDEHSLRRIEEAYAEQIVRRTRFGGLHLRINDVPIDLWSLPHTWAFEQGHIKTDFEQLPRTTFLNVEAVIARFNPSTQTEPEIFEHGFFEAMRTRVLEINFEPNPFPELCVIRSLVCAMKLRFSIGPRLASYISRQASYCDDERFEQVQESHYGYSPIDRKMLLNSLGQLDRHVRRRSNSPIHLRTSA